MSDIGVARRKFKSILFQKLSSKSASQIVASIDRDVRHMNPLEKYVHLKCLIDSVNMSIGDRKDILLFFASAIYRSSLSTHQKSIMDSREINTFRDLNKFTTSLHSTDSDRSVGSRGSGRGASGFGVKCYRCQGFGHRSFECRVSREESKPSIICHSCQQPGHKSPEYPNKGVRASSRKQSRPAEGGKWSLGLKAGTKSLNAS